MRGITLVQRLFKRKLSLDTAQSLDALAQVNHHRQEKLSEALAKLAPHGEQSISFGTAAWGQNASLSVDKALTHGLVLGASGAGKSFVALSLISQMLALTATKNDFSFAILDAKGELFERVIPYLYAHLYRLSPDEREKFQKRIAIIDFANTSAIAPYNILAKQTFVPDELIVANRIDTISEQFSGLSEVSVRMKMILRYLLLLLTEQKLPISFLERLCIDPLLLSSLVDRSANLQVKDYFQHRFDDESKSTLLALRQRIDSLLISEGVRLSLSASSAPDFTALQDQGAIILINTAGRTINRGVSELLQGLILSDIKQSVFRRTNPGRRFLWFLDEAQNLYHSPANRAHMVDLMTMARSFGSFFVLLTQSLTSAVHDQDILNSIMANVRWLVMLRSTPRDAQLIAPSIPLTGTVAKHKHNPYGETKYLTEAEELKGRLNEISKLPDRLGYLWLKASLPASVKMTTLAVPKPHEVARTTPEEFESFVQGASLGQGISKADIVRAIREREQSLGLLPHDSASDAKPTKIVRPKVKAGAKKLAKRLEEEYEKKSPAKKRRS